MSASWYLGRDGKVEGPLTVDEIKKRASDSESTATQLVWRTGFDSWMPIEEVSELQSNPLGPPPLPESQKADVDHNSQTSVYVDSARQESVAPQSSTFDRPVSKKSNFVAWHWRGELPLPISYWAISFLTLAAMMIVSLSLTEFANARSSFNPLNILVIFSSVWATAICLTVWQLVGTWRSAGRYIELKTAQKKNAVWGGVARFMIVVGALRFIADFLTSGTPAQVVELSKIAFADDPGIAPFSIRVMRNEAEIEISGGIKYGLAAAFRQHLNNNPNIKVVHLDSAGGRLGEGKELFKIIKDNALKTYVSHQCASACTLAFMGGRERWLGPRGRLGFHAGNFAGESDASATAYMREAYQLGGLPRTFIERVVATPFSQIWVPTADELISSRVITNIAKGDEFAASGYGSDMSPGSIGSQLSKAIPLFATVKQVAQADFDLMVLNFISDYEKGKTEFELMGNVNQRLSGIIDRFRPFSTDDTTVEIGRVIIEQYKALNSRDATACYTYAALGGNSVQIASLLPAALRQREANLNQKILQSPPFRIAVDSTKAERLLAQVISKLGRRLTSQQIALMQAKQVPLGQHADYCALSIAMFEEIIAYPPSEAANALRQILLAN